MIENDIYEESNNFIVKKEIHGKWITFGSFKNLDDAIELRDELEDYGWPYRDDTQRDEVEKYIYRENNKFLVSKKFIGHDIVFGIFDSLDKAKSFKRRLVQNAWNLNFYTRPSKYGKYIKRVGAKRYGIFKDINGEDINFGYFKTVDEAIIARDGLVDNNWNMGEDKILSNLGIVEFDLGIGLVGRKFIVFEWDESECIIYGFYTSRRLATEAKEKLLNKNNIDEGIDYNYEDTRYIHRVNDYYRITRVFDGKPKNFGHYKSLEEAISIRDELIQNNWDDSFLELNRITRGEDSYNRHIHKSSRGYDVVNHIGDSWYNFGSFESLEEAISFRDYLEENNWEIIYDDDDFEEEKYDEFIFLKNDGKYYLKNEIDGVMRIFGIFDNPLDAIGARLDCIKNNWNSVSIAEEEYFKDPNSDFNFGYLNDDELEEITEDMVGSNILNKSIDFPVTVGKSYKNGGWAVKRSYLNDFIPLIPFEKKCSIIVEGIKVSGKMNIHTRLFYFKDNVLSEYLEKLYDIDPKTQTRITFELNHGIYKYSDENIDDLEFITKFSKSFKKGLFAVPRSISKNIIPILPYEQECNFLINGIKCIGKFNLEFRFRFSDNSFISHLESKFEENDELNVNLVL